MLRVACVIPAHNEAPRVAAVVRAAIQAGCLASVTVVDDGSTDGTADVAKRAGASVLSLSPNRGKGGAMLAATSRLLADPSIQAVAYLDADLIGLEPHHVCTLVAAVQSGAGMACGTMDDGPRRNDLWRNLPPLTGQRVVVRGLLERLPLCCWQGYRIEIGLNVAAERFGYRTELVPWPGVHGLHKLDKDGLHQGMARHARMFREILLAMGLANQAMPAPPGMPR